MSLFWRIWPHMSVQVLCEKPLRPKYTPHAAILATAVMTLGLAGRGWYGPPRTIGYIALRRVHCTFERRESFVDPPPSPTAPRGPARDFPIICFFDPWCHICPTTYTDTRSCPSAFHAPRNGGPPIGIAPKGSPPIASRGGPPIASIICLTACICAPLLSA